LYEDYFRLTAAPFSIAPDPRFLYMSARHREAIAHLLFGVRGEGGFVLLTGEIGTGKTTLCRSLLEQIPDLCDVAFILNPKLGMRDLLATICEEFHVELPTSGPVGIKQLVDAINRHLLHAHAAVRRALLIIDEAQNLQPEVIELLRLLTNLETNTRKLLQVILIGQPELQDMLRRPEMRQVAQRVVARFHLTELTHDEVAAYVKHRLRVAGSVAPLIPDRLMGRLYRVTQGVPRLINLVCDRALLGAFVEGRTQVTRAVLDKAAREVFGIVAPQPRWRHRLAASAVAASCGLLLAGYAARPQWQGVLSAVAPPMLAVAATQPALPEPRPPPVQPAAVEPAPAPPAEPPLAATLDWPDHGIPATRSEGLAFQALLGLYGVSYLPGPGTAPCGAAAAARLRCLSGRGGLADLLRFNEPAVIALDGGAAPHYHALLTAVDARSATVIVGGEARRVALTDLTPAWSGSYVLLWRPPPGGSDALATGSRGQGVTWLRQRLADVDGDQAAGPASFDDDLVRRTKAFQLAEGIVPDGVAGALTLVRLDQRLDKHLPRLSPDPDGDRHVLHP
jgi:general secretion pathway protein A